jgi:hypothetical protein
MRILPVAVVLFVTLSSIDNKAADAFSMLPRQTVHNLPTTTTLCGKSRKARRQEEQKQNKQRPKFLDAIEDAEDDTTTSKNGFATATAVKDDEDNKQKKEPSNQQQDDDPGAARRNAIKEEAEQRYLERPEVSSLITDEESGRQVLIQGQKVMDVVTRQAVKLSDLGPEYRLAQMFPGVPPETRSKYRFDVRTITLPEMVDQLMDVCSTKLEDGSRGIPPHPSITNKAIDYVLANRDFLGWKMTKAIGSRMMNLGSKGDLEQAEQYKKLGINYATIEKQISGPFRQIMQDAEGRVGPNFGNLDIKSYCSGELYERIGNYLVLKGMVAHWEKKVVDANFIENVDYEEFEDDDSTPTTIIGVGDPRRFLPNPPILFTLRECTQVCAMAQKLCQMFVEDEELYADFPPEIVFLEDALKIKGGTALRQYMVEEFCPQREITPEALREGMRRFYQQMDNMQADPYCDLTNKIEQLYRAMAVGTDDGRDPYEPYMGPDAPMDLNSNPFYAETYTFNYDQMSLMNFLDNNYRSGGAFSVMVGELDDEDAASGSSNPLDMFGNVMSGLIGFDDNSGRQLRPEVNLLAEEPDYETPEARADSRPHDIGWFEKINTPNGKPTTMGDIKPGRIIPDE